MNQISEITSRIEAIFGAAPFGISYSTYVSAVAVLVGSLVMVWLIRPVLNRFTRRNPDNKQKALRESIVDAIVPPLRVLPIIIGIYVSLHILSLSGKASVVAGELLKTLIIAAIFWALARLSGNSSLIWDRLNLTLERSTRRWLGYTLQILVLLCGAAIILEIWNVPVAPLIGSLGVFGIAVGLAAKDLFSNLISGVLIMTEKRFSAGEWIKVDGVVEGTVEQIDFRSTKIRRFDLSPVYVPNSLLADNAMTNFSRMTYRRINWMIGLEYGTPPEKLEEIRDRVGVWLQSDERICQPPEASLFVRVDSFGDSSINLMIYCFTKTTIWADWLKIKEDFALAMIPIVKRAGSGFAFPSRSIFLHQVDPPEIINPRVETQQ